MADKQVKVKVTTDVEMSDVESLENKINQLKKEQIDLKINSNQKSIANIDEDIARLKNEIRSLSSTELDVRTNANQINTLVDKIEALEQKKINLNIDIEKSQLDRAEAEIEKLDDSEIDLQVNNISAMQSIDQIGQGFDRLKAGATELGQQVGSVLESAGKQEANKTFLEMNIGAGNAKTKLEEINDVVQKLPGDDTVLQGLLSSAVAKNASLTANELNNMGSAAADYFSAMQYYGKSSTEAQQDMTNYILAGNTAELERSPILSSHIDKLKEASTVQERSLALQEALNQEGWGGMSQQDTYNNKLQTFMSMIERGKYNLGGMLQEGAKAGMDLALQLDNATGGLFGMGIALAGMASPVTDTLMGLGQLATGITTLKSAYTALIPTQWAEAVAGWASIGWILLAIALGIALGLAIIYLYNNVDWFKQGVDNLVLALQNFVGMIYGAVTGAINWLSGLFTRFTSQIGLNTNNWIEAILGFILFIPTLPLQLGIALANAIAKTLGFGNNFVQKLGNSARNAVNGFLNYIRQLPGIVMGEFNRVLGLVNDFINTLPQRVWDMGVAIIDALKKSLGIGSPGHMYYMLEGELNRLDNLPNQMSGSISGNIESMGANMVHSFEDTKFTSGSVGGNNVTQTFNIEIGNVDSEERIQEIVDVIRRELAWDNRTAGRTV